MRATIYSLVIILLHQNVLYGENKGVSKYFKSADFNTVCSYMECKEIKLSENNKVEHHRFKVIRLLSSQFPSFSTISCKEDNSDYIILVMSVIPFRENKRIFKKESTYILPLKRVEYTGLYYLEDAGFEPPGFNDKLEKLVIKKIYNRDTILLNKELTKDKIINSANEMVSKLEKGLLEFEKHNINVYKYISMPYIERKKSKTFVFKYIANDSLVVLARVKDNWNLVINGKQKEIEPAYTPLIIDLDKGFVFSVSGSAKASFKSNDLDFRLIDFGVGPFKIGLTWEVKTNIKTKSYDYSVVIYLKFNADKVGYKLD